MNAMHISKSDVSIGRVLASNARGNGNCRTNANALLTNPAREYQRFHYIGGTDNSPKARILGAAARQNFLSSLA